MEKTSIYKFYRLGKLISEFDSETEPSNFELYNKITNFFDFVNELNLQVTNTAITLGDIKKIYKSLDIESKKYPSNKVSFELVKKINFEIKKVLITFEAEILNKNSFILKDKKFKIEYLIDDQTQLFKSKDVLLNAHFDIQFNVIESAKCLAFDRNTASAFHILLATEEYVKFFNDNFFDEVESDMNSEISFYDSIKDTEQILADLKHDSELISLLHIIRKYYRNQSQHSNRKYSEIEATDLFNLCIKVMNELYKILEKNIE